MTAIAAWVGPADRTGLVTEVLNRMPDRGSDLRARTVEGHGVLGASVFEWHTPWTGDALGALGSVDVAADATLYYVDELCAALHAGNAVPRSRTPADLIAAAVWCWGEDAPKHLEGDYAYVALDRTRRRLFAARDWNGLRSIYFARAEDGLILASEALAVALAPGVDRSLNLPFLCEAFSARFESLTESVFSGVSLLPAGHSLSVGLDSLQPPTPERFFVPPTFLGEAKPRVSFEDAKGELRRLLEDAVRSRLPDSPQGVVVGLSGGRDSPAVYALARRLAGERVKSVSVSYPKGDPGYEDDVISDVLAQCGGTPSWIKSDEIGVLGSIEETARTAHEPFLHLFSEFQIALAKGTLGLGSRVMLNGSGGDQFFSGEPSYLADLLAGGRLIRLFKEWRALGAVTEWKAFFKLAVWPNLGPLGHGVVRTLRKGRDLPDPFDSPLAPWISDDPHLRDVLEKRHRANFPARSAAAGAADFERRWLLTHPFFPRVFAEAFRTYLKHGVELRTPMADLRVMRFAATRPRRERRTGWDMKLLLRACLNDLLPPSVTGPRPRPTGTTDGLLVSSIARILPGHLARLESSPLCSVKLGLVARDAFLAHLHRLTARGTDPHALVGIYSVLAEAWLKEHSQVLDLSQC